MVKKSNRVQESDSDPLSETTELTVVKTRTIKKTKKIRRIRERRDSCICGMCKRCSMCMCGQCEKCKRRESVNKHRKKEGEEKKSLDSENSDLEKRIFELEQENLFFDGQIAALKEIVRMQEQLLNPESCDSNEEEENTPTVVPIFTTTIEEDVHELSDLDSLMSCSGEDSSSSLGE